MGSSTVEEELAIQKAHPAMCCVPPPNAAGTNTYTRLAGQHVQYLMKQLRSFQDNLRDVAVMHGVMLDDSGGGVGFQGPAWTR
jgi:cytochrome c553